MTDSTIIVSQNRLWREPHAMFNILRHPFSQDPLPCFTNQVVWTLRDQHGALISYLVMERHSSYWHLKDVFTFRRFRGKGYARFLIGRVLKSACTERNSNVFLLCPDYRVSFYEEQGFSMAPHAPTRVRMLHMVGDFFLKIFYRHHVHILQSRRLE